MTTFQIPIPENIPPMFSFFMQIGALIVKLQNLYGANPDIADSIAKYNIESYPTIKMIINSKQYEFDTKISFNALKEFANVTTKSQSNA